VLAALTYGADEAPISGPALRAVRVVDDERIAHLIP
jgi:hypothetical protein